MAASTVSHALSALTLGPTVCVDQGSLRCPISLSSGVSLAGVSESGGAAQRGRLQIRCARVGGVEIPNNKRVEVALTYIHGVGNTTSKQILLDVGLENKITKELSEEELTSLRDEVSKYMIEGDLRRFNTLAIKRLKDIQCYRGKRHLAGLPCRGQSTKCNARTRRGKKVTIAGKKKAPGK
ncbi:30S ribosomal protein S13, chloroplastic-like [Physcomitrium patens]|uniref:Uncharacterized protein n=1 Tax=Physcomitrium patens TaxID=3218 RepID=A0A2K1JCW8_PHYPA|nr:30S ribosomal protein S13, chloroplastic-like [Physcomitrium patens]PNR39371.1 hypothetical protein PHYPA_019649 [Physcomitrium patens]